MIKKNLTLIAILLISAIFLLYFFSLTPMTKNIPVVENLIGGAIKAHDVITPLSTTVIDILS